MKRFIITFAALILMGQAAFADEGMWMINAINAALEKQMQERGLELPAKAIYDADAPGASISDAVVSMSFGCTGSIISDRGLLITNHHCAYSDVHAISTPEHNYLEEGFWAMKDEEEIPITGKKVQFLHKVLDVTDEVNALIQELKTAGKPSGLRKIGYMMEQKYQKETGYMAWFSSMWAGQKYYMSLYQEYSDVRLVAAPPVSMAAFGGDIDNWEWPQHKCDFAMYRVYTAPDGSDAEYSPENIPLKPEKKLSISLEGYKPGDYTMTLGYPASTDRYSSSAEVRYKQDMSHPIANRIRGEQMAIVMRHMEADPQVRLKYADFYFSLSNVQELQSGEVKCFKRFGVVEKKKKVEKKMQEWIDDDQERKDKWGGVIEALDTKYPAIEEVDSYRIYFRETLIRGTRLTRVLGKVMSKRMNGVLEEYDALDMDTEKDLFAYAVKEFYSNVPEEFRADYHNELLKEYKGDYEVIAEKVWASSVLTSKDALKAALDKGAQAADLHNDSFYKFMRDLRITAFNEVIDRIEGEDDVYSLGKTYTHALYQMRLAEGKPQYPDANSTMRLSYGTVGGIEPYDGVVCSWKTSVEGILEKYNPADYDFNLSDRQYLLYRKGDWGRWDFNVNFLTDNDITGGNSGSPVLNSKGELIGLAFDGNKESLASDAWYTPGYTKCVCVDIRYVLWTLDRYAGMSHIIAELGL